MTHPKQHTLPSDQRPIGVFDSGVGGLSVLKEIKRALPGESTLYIADNLASPYGEKDPETIYRRCLQLTEYLISKDAKLVVMACNSATSVAVAKLREQVGVPIVAIEPAIKPAVQVTRNKRIGLIATPMTVNSDNFTRLVNEYANGIDIHVQACEGLASSVEAGDDAAAERDALLQHYLAPLIKSHIDTLVLGCTHYPFLSEAIQAKVGQDVTLIDPSPAVAQQVKRVLTDKHLLAVTDMTTYQNVQNRFYSTSDPVHQVSGVMRSLMKRSNLLVQHASIPFTTG